MFVIFTSVVTFKINIFRFYVFFYGNDAIGYVQIWHNLDMCYCSAKQYEGRSCNQKLSLHYLVIRHCVDGDCDLFWDTISQCFTENTIGNYSVEFSGQYKNRLWHELRYKRVTTSKTYEVILSYCRWFFDRYGYWNQKPGQVSQKEKLGNYTATWK